MTVTEIWLGIPCTEAAQSAMLDKGYQLQPHTHGAHRQRYVMAHRAFRHRPAVSSCMEAVQLVFDVSPEMILGSRGCRKRIRARFAVMWAARQLGMSYPQIGMRLNRDHSTVYDGVGRCEEFQAEDPAYRDACQRVMSMVRSA